MGSSGLLQVGLVVENDVDTQPVVDFASLEIILQKGCMQTDRVANLCIFQRKSGLLVLENFDLKVVLDADIDSHERFTNAIFDIARQILLRHL